MLYKCRHISAQINKQTTRKPHSSWTKSYQNPAASRLHPRSHLPCTSSPLSYWLSKTLFAACSPTCFTASARRHLATSNAKCIRLWMCVCCRRCKEGLTKPGGEGQSHTAAPLLGEINPLRYVVTILWGKKQHKENNTHFKRQFSWMTLQT